jgi:hypothetical protein
VRPRAAIRQKLQLEGSVPANFSTPAGGVLRNATATGRRCRPSISESWCSISE